MQKNRLFQGILLVIFIAGLIVSCQKKRDYINEEKIGSGIHYYPTILNDNYFDTLSKQNLQGTTLSWGQNIIFQLLYRSKDSLLRLELWASKDGHKSQKIWSTAYSSSFYSNIQQSDTTYIHYQVPMSDTTFSSLTLSPKIITKKGLETEEHINFDIKK